jgi:hypothetical protein
MSGGSAKSIFHPPIETPSYSYAVSPTRESAVGGFGTGSPPSAVKTTALSVKDDRVSAWPRVTVPLLSAFEKTATAADRTNIKSATWIRSFVICVSLKRVGTRKAWIVTPPRGPWLAYGGNQKGVLSADTWLASQPELERQGLASASNTGDRRRIAKNCNGRHRIQTATYMKLQHRKPALSIARSW